jgi:predicted RNase H-like nuclease
MEGKKMSQQSWAIVPKTAEVDSLLRQRPELRSLLYEVHPEVSFYFMGGSKPNTYSKKEKSGIDERIRKLSDSFRINHQYISVTRHQHRVSEDDVVDALAALWSAVRVFRRENIVLREDSDTGGPGIYA